MKKRKTPDGHSAAGTQSIGRSVSLLRIVSTATSAGLRVSEIATQSGLHLATTHRLLSALCREGLVMQLEETKRYVLGPELWALALTAQHRHGLGDRLLPALEALAQETGDVAYASIRAGDEAVCLARREGAFPIRALALEPGSRRPLGIGAGSLILLSFLPAAEREAIIERNVSRYTDYGITMDTVRGFVEDTRRTGRALNHGYIISGMGALGLPVLSTSGRMVAAISVAAITSRMGPERQPYLLDLTHKAIASLGPMPD